MLPNSFQAFFVFTFGNGNQCREGYVLDLYFPVPCKIMKQSVPFLLKPADFQETVQAELERQEEEPLRTVAEETDLHAAGPVEPDASPTPMTGTEAIDSVSLGVESSPPGNPEAVTPATIIPPDDEDSDASGPKPTEFNTQPPDSSVPPLPSSPLDEATSGENAVKKARQLAAQGVDAATIVRQTGLPTGEVALILKLKNW